MVKLTETYKDFDGNERTEDFYFNLTKAEVIKLQLRELGGLSNYLEKIVSAIDTPTIIDTFEKVLKVAYGEKTADGRGFMKSEEIWERFACTEAYSNIFTRYATDDQAASDFINKLIPAEMIQEIIRDKENAEKRNEGSKITSIDR